METKKRVSGIELLRIFTMLGVVFLHYNDGRAFTFVENNTLNYYVLFFLESFCICAVDLFILISGYFLCNSQKRSLGKIISLVLEFILVKEGMYIISSLVMKNESFSLRTLIFNILPNNYFIILYIALYLISPYINIIFSKFSKNNWNVFMLTALLLFSVWPTLIDLMEEIAGHELMGLSTISRIGSAAGFNIVNFILLYIVGAYLRKCGIKDKYNKNSILIPSILICVFLIFIWALVNERMQLFGLRSAWNYHNPLVIMLAAMIFIVFSNMKFYTKWVNELAKAAFTCFLVHNYLLDKVKIDVFVRKNLFIMLGHIIIVIVGMYLISYILYKIYDLISKPLIKKLDTITLPQINIE